MKKLILIILGLALAGSLFYFLSQPRPDETKTQGEPEDDSLTTIDQELSATELQDFDQEIQALDKSINQL